jgi:formylmethanofuran dehydrogenase subunit E
MSKRIGNKVIISAEKPQQCDMCGEIDELRPYGPNGECICFKCGEKDPETTKRMMAKKLFGIEV